MIHWNASPEIFSLGPITLRWYGLLFALGFLIGYHIMKRFFVREGKPPALMDSVLIYMVIGTVVGARLGHTLFYEPNIYLREPWRILQVWEGGLASHGAAVGILLAVYLFTRRHRQFSFLWLMDRITVVTALAGGFIRLGNLFNSEIVGKPATIPWAFVFDQVDQAPRHPTQLYEALSYFVIFAILYRLWKKRNIREKQGFLFGLFLILVFGVRFIVEFFKENQVGFEASLPLNMGQLLSIPLIGVGAWLIARARPQDSGKKPRKDGR